MVTITPKTVVTHRITGVATTDARTDLTVRGHGITIDERRESGGTDQGISPVETLLTALIGCTNRITHKLAAEHGVEISEMAVDLESHFDRRGTQLQDEVNIPFPAIILKIQVTTDADAAAMKRVQADLPKFCPVSKVLRMAGTRITEEWVVRQP